MKILEGSQKFLPLIVSGLALLFLTMGYAWPSAHAEFASEIKEPAASGRGIRRVPTGDLCITFGTHPLVA